MSSPSVPASSHLAHVTYEIRGPLARRADELERAGARIVRLNVGNPGAFGFRAPPALQQAIIEHLPEADAYCHQQGIAAAREAVAAEERSHGVSDASAQQVFMGNGVSELILMALRALLNDGDEVLIPSPDYPLWTAATILAGGTAVHYPCARERGFVPDPAEVERLVSPRTRALVVISPNNPTGAVYPLEVARGLAALAERRKLVLFSDEIYDRITYDGARHHAMAPLAPGTLVGTFNGLSKVYRSCGFRVGWLSFSGAVAAAREYLTGLDLLAGLRLCANVPGQWAVPAALSAAQGIAELTAPGGRLHRTRQAVLDAVARSRFLEVTAPQGAIYAFVRIRRELLPDLDDARFALELLNRRHIFITPGHGFNVPYRDHFRITLLPEAAQMAEVFASMETLLAEHASGRLVSA
jgi:alanine-synthesizing transaminase